MNTEEERDEVVLEKLDEASCDWSRLSTMKYLTCVNHPTARYLTKNPWTRGLHFVHPPVEAPVEDWPLGGMECPCPFSDLRYIASMGES